MQQVYQRNNFKVYRGKDCYILHNASLDGFQHTHLDSMKQCCLLIQLSLEKRIPYDLSNYLLISLSRINDGSYKEKVLEVIQNKRKKDTYYNKRKVKNGRKRNN